jgi:hypothetical protein
MTHGLSLLKGDFHKNPFDKNFKINKDLIEIYNEVYDLFNKKRFKNMIHAKIITIIKSCKLQPNDYEKALMWLFGIVPLLIDDELYIATYYKRLCNIAQCKYSSLNSYFMTNDYYPMVKNEMVDEIIDNSIFFISSPPEIIKYFNFKKCNEERKNELLSVIRANNNESYDGDDEKEDYKEFNVEEKEGDYDELEEKNLVINDEPNITSPLINQLPIPILTKSFPVPQISIPFPVPIISSTSPI